MAAANSFLSLCIVLAAVGNPSAHAVPMIYPQQWVLIQQTSTIDEITTALSVSNKSIASLNITLHCYKIMHTISMISLFEFFHSMQEALNQLVNDAAQNIVTDLQNALFDYVQETINDFAGSYGATMISADHIEFTVDPTSTLDLFQVFPFGSSNLLPAIGLERVMYTYDTSELVVDTRGYGSQTIIPGVLQLENVALSFTIRLLELSSLEVAFRGQFLLGGATVAVNAISMLSSGEVMVGAMVSELDINLQSAATQLTGLDLPSALDGQIAIPEFIISGTATSDEKELIISATGGDVHVYLVYKKANQAKKAIAVELTSSIELASVLSDVTGLDISGIPYFGTAVLPTIALTYATDSIELPDDVFANSPLLSDLGNTIEEDFTALILFDFSDDPIRLHYSGGLPSFQPASPGSLSVNSLISAIPSVDLSSIPLPPGVGGVLDLSIDEFVLNIQDRSIKIAASYPGSLTFFDGFLTIDNPTIVVEASTQGVTVDVDGDLSISGSDFDASIERDEASGDYVLSAQATELPITSLISQFQSEVLPSELNSLLSSLPFFSFSIEDPSISFPLSSSPLQIQLGGTPVVSGYSTVHMASVIIRQGGKTLLVQGFDLGAVNLASFLQGITGFNFNTIPILNQDLEAAILISPVTLPNVQLTGDKLGGFSVTKGLSVQATMQFPPDCSADAFCAVAAFLLGPDAQLNIQGTIASATDFSLVAGVSNINLGSGIVMSEAGVEIKGGLENSVGIFGAIDLSDPDITLTGRVFLSTSGVVLEMTMSGCWEDAFGASWLDICSIEASVAMIPGVTLTGLSLGAQVRIGDDSCGTPLTATGFVGIDILTPTRNYYYVKLEGSATVGSILEALCIDISIPAPLAESGFPNGFLSSFSLFGVELPHVPLSIPQGYRFKGTLNILGLEASADVNIGFPDGIYFAVALPPIDVGGLLRMSASQSDTSNGPFLMADIDLLPSPNVDVQASGYLSVLGISLETTLTITNTQYIFNIQGSFLGLFEASLHIYASYGSIQTAAFRVQGSFTNNLYSTLENQIKNVLNAAGEEATKAFDAVEGELNSAKDTLDSAQDTLDAARREVDSAQSAFDDAVDEVASLRRDVDSICSTKSCGSGEFNSIIRSNHLFISCVNLCFIPVCVGCPDGFTCCGTVWGACVCTHPTWNSCCTRIPDPICEGENVACLALKEPIKLALKAAEEIVDSSRVTLEAAKAALALPEAALRAAEEGVNLAQTAVDGVEAAYAAGLEAAEFVAKLGLNGLISIREISFDVSLGAASGGSFSGSVTAVFGGAAEVTISFNINIYDITSMVKQLVDQIGDGLSSLF